MTYAKVRRRPVYSVPWQEVDQFPPPLQIDDGELFALSLSNNTTRLTHGLHRFPAKFIPQLPAWGLKHYGLHRRVLDPFMGSGTTLVESLVAGSSCVGVDTDPLARLITSAKSGEARSGELVGVAEELINRWRRPASRLYPPMPDVGNFGHWFSRDSWAWLQSLLALIERMDCSDEARRFLLVAFSSILRRVSLADDQSQKTYVSGTLRKVPPDVRTTFERALHRAINGLRDLEAHRVSRASARVCPTGDARSLPLRRASIDLIFTSPPYLDSVDYMYNMMLEYFWLGSILGVPTRTAFNRLRREAIGARNPHGVPSAPACIGDLLAETGLSPSRRRAALGYFSGMATHFAEAARVLKADGRYVMVVGNSATRRGIVPVHEGLVRVALEAGFTMEHVFGYRVRRHYMKFPRRGRGGIILLDWVIVLRKSINNRSPRTTLPLAWPALHPGSVSH